MVSEERESWIKEKKGQAWIMGKLANQRSTSQVDKMPNLSWQPKSCQQELSNAVYYWCLQHMGISDRILDPKTVLGIVCCSLETNLLHLK